MLKGWQLIENKNKKLKMIKTQRVNEIFKIVNNDVNTNSSSTSTSV